MTSKIRLVALVTGELAGSRALCINANLPVAMLKKMDLLADDKLTEWYFIGYMGAWVANALIGKTLVSKDGDEYAQRAEQYRTDIDSDENINK